MADSTGRKSAGNNKGRSRIIILILVFAAIFAYLVVYSITYFMGNKSDIFEVVSGATMSSSGVRYDALVIRSEEVVKAADSGYINFFVADSMPVAVGAQAYVIDASGELSDRLEELSRGQSVLERNDLLKIRNTLYDFDTTYDEDNYFEVYNAKYRVQSQILDLINSSVFDNLNASMSQTADNTYRIVNSEISGLVVHSLDGYENITIDDVEASMFRRENYNRSIIKSNDLVERNSDIYKVITSEEWSLVIQLPNANTYTDLSTIEFTFLSDGIQTEGDFQTFTRAGITYGVIDLKKYMVRYASDRFLQIEIKDNLTSGLRIPKPAVTEKQFYMIPRDYYGNGGNTTSKGFSKYVVRDDGTFSLDFVTPEVVKITDEYCYVSVDSFEPGDILVNIEDNSQYKLNAKENLQGVYVLNSGEYNFKVIELLGENNGFYIIDSQTQFGVRIYDQILNDASKYVE